MPQYQPKTVGIVRVQGKTRMHEEVMKNLQKIADSEDKTFAYVVSEIVYAFFGLKVTKDAVKITRTRRKKATRERDRRAA